MHQARRHGGHRRPSFLDGTVWEGLGGSGGHKGLMGKQGEEGGLQAPETPEMQIDTFCQGTGRFGLFGLIRITVST